MRSVIDLEKTYGPVYYDLVYKDFPPPEDIYEVISRCDYMNQYLKDHPLLVFKTGNNATIGEFNIYFDNKRYNRETIEEYNRLRHRWEIERGGIKAKPSLVNILDQLNLMELSFTDLVDIYRTEKFQGVLAHTEFGKNLLGKLDDYGETIPIPDMDMKILVLAGIKYLKRGIVYSRYNLNFNEFEDMIFNYNKMSLDNLNYDKEFPLVLSVVLPHLNNLLSLMIYNIRIEDYEIPFSVNSNLKELILEGDKDVKVFPGYLLHNLKYLHTLSITRNKFQTFQKDSFHNLVNLRELDLSQNKLKTLPRGIFDGLVNLQVLNLSQNKLKTLGRSLFKGLDNLVELFLARNEIERIPSNIFDPLIKLEELDLSQNNIRSLSEKLFKNLLNLEELDLINNPIENFRLPNREVTVIY